MARRILFLCSRNKLRSPTAEAIFGADPELEVDSAGLSRDAEVVVSAEQIEWAEVILVMEQVHRTRLNRMFRPLLGGKRIGVLNIPDDHEFMDPALVGLLETRCRPFFR